MKKLIAFFALAAILTLSVSAFADGTVQWTFSKAGNSVLDEIGNVTGSVYFGNEPVDLIHAEVLDSADEWLVNGNIPAGSPSSFSFYLSGLPEDVLQDVEDNINVYFAYYFNEEHQRIIYVNDFTGMDRTDGMFTLYFTPENDVFGIYEVALDFSGVEGGEIRGEENIGASFFEFGYTEKEEAAVPEPATAAYALMGLGSLAGIKRRIKK